MNPEPIKYDPEGEHKDLDLTGWWVLLASAGVGRVYNHATVSNIIWIYGGLVTRPHRVTHLLGVNERPKLTPQELADTIQHPIVRHGHFGQQEWHYDTGDGKGIVIAGVAECDPAKHPTRIQPRPIYRVES